MTGADRPIRVLHSIKLLSAGGVERLRMSIFQYLGLPDFEHRLICTEVTDPWARERVRQLGIQVYETGPVRSILSPGRYWHGARIARSWRPDIIHGAIIEGYTLAVVSGRLSRTRSIVMEETSGPGGRGRKATLLVRALAHEASVCIAVSNAVALHLQSIGVPPRKIQTIYNGVAQLSDVGIGQRASLRDSLGWAPADVIVGTVSRLDDAVKRVSDLIDAVGISHAHGIPLRLLIVGDGSDRARLEEMAASKAPGAVRFVGQQSNLAPLYGAMDIFALASAREAFGMVLVEAMQAGLPVVATRVGGIPEIVVNNETGFLVPQRRPTELAARLRMLAADPWLRRRMGQAAKVRALAFSEVQYVEKVERLYRELAGGGHVAAH